MGARIEVTPQADERLWLQRAVLVLVSPGDVFAALRDDSDAVARAREEAVLAIVFIAGIATVLWTPVAGRLLKDVTLDWLDVAVWAFLGGGLYGFVVYWLAGAVVHWVSRLGGGSGSYRRARHLVAYAAAPLALSLFLVWPLRLAVYGEDVFREGGSDHGAGNWAFVFLELALAAWALGLLAFGLRIVQRWSWPRAVVVTAVSALVPVLLVLVGEVA
ncbi:MAG TPA: Yip1 family protein [Gaiellaceae bacterium]|nr:Yip1 family protein [Gaiellaceae bacterium]